MSQNFIGKKIDGESFVRSFLVSDNPKICVVMNHMAYESEELDDLIKTLTEMGDKFNLGLRMQVHPYQDNTYFVMIEMEKA